MKDELVALLDEILPLAKFKMPGATLGLEAYRRGYTESQTFAGIQRIRPSRFVYAEIDVVGVPDSLFERLVEGFRFLLGPYFDPGNSRIVLAASSVTGGGMYPEPEIDRLARQGIRCAALAGSVRTVEILLGWTHGEPIQYTQVMVLQGIRQEEDILDLWPGVRLERISRDDGLFDEIPEDLALKTFDSIEECGLPGAAVLCVDAAAGPPICKPGHATRLMPDVDRRLSLHYPPGRLLQALALACDSPVEVIHAWISFDNALALLAGCRNQPQSWPLRWGVGSVELAQRHLDRARDLCEKLGEHPSPEFQVAIQRWMKSKPLCDLVNDSIDLRIALEAFFYQGGENTELSLRLALRGAWYLGVNESERAEYFETLRQTY